MPERGRLRRSDLPPRAAGGDRSVLTTAAPHLVDLLVFLAVVTAPLPLCLALVEADRHPVGRSVLALLTAWCVVQVCVGLVLGWSGYFRLRGLLVVEGAVLVAGLALLRAAAFRAAAPPRGARLDRAEQLVAFALGVLGLTLLLRLAMTPITDYDSLAYHLPVMAKWYQEHAFAMLEQFRSQISRYPYDWEVLSALFLMPFREDFLVALPNLIAWVLFGLSIHLLSVELGAGRTWALLAAFLALAMPMTRKHVNTMLVDLALGAFFMVALYFAAAYSRSRKPSDAALFVAAVGMVAGIKTSGVVYVALLAAAFLLLGALGEPARDRGRTPLLVLGPMALLAGGFWYVRNLIALGNPLGHVRVAFGGITLLPGELDVGRIRRTTLAHVFDPTAFGDWQILIGAMAHHLGLPFLLIVLSALALRLGDRRPERTRIGILLGLLLATGAAYWTTPYSADNGAFGGRMDAWIGQAFRYAFPFLGVLAVLGALGGSRLPARKELVVVPVVIAVVAGMTSGTMAVAAFVAAAGMVFVTRSGRTLRWAGAGLLGVAFIAGTLWLRAARAAERAREYGGVPEFIATHLRSGEVVGYLLSNQSYLFYGNDYGVRVAYVPAADDGADGWVESLRRRQVGLVAVGPVGRRGRTRRELAWLSHADGPFVRVFGEDVRREPVVFRLKDARPEPVAAPAP